MFRVTRHEDGEVVRYHMARTVAGQPIYIGTCYRLPGAGAMVDSGPSHTGKALMVALKGETVEAVLCTHGHEDHVGNNARLGERVRVLASASVQVPERVPLYRRVAWGVPRSGAIEAVGDGWDPGRGLQLVPVPTPGHSADHLAYLEPDRGWLFAGDAALGKLKYGFRDEDIHAYMASLRTMMDRKPTVVFPAHGPVLTRPQEQLREQLAHLEALQAEARRLRSEGLDEGTITRRLLGRDGLMGLSSRGEFSRRRLIEGLLREPGGGGRGRPGR